MFREIRLRLHYRMNSEQKARRSIGKLSASMNSDIGVQGCRQYWKDKSLLQIDAVIPLGVEAVSDAIFEALTKCSWFASSWIVNVPQHYEGNRWEFSGIAVNESIAIQGLVFAEFRVCNYDA